MQRYSRANICNCLPQRETGHFQRKFITKRKKEYIFNADFDRNLLQEFKYNNFNYHKSIKKHLYNFYVEFSCL